jgi:hypothetical protein
MPRNDTSDHAGRFDRQTRAFGTDATHRLQSSTVAVIGCSGLGSHYIQLLARLGVQHLVLIDPDSISRSNLSRLVGIPDSAVGTPKVDAFAAVADHAQPGIDVTTVQQPVQQAANQLDAADPDLLMGGVDTPLARAWTNLYGQDHGIPYIDAGVSITIQPGGGDRAWQSSGTIQRIIPGETACIECVGRINWDQLHAHQLDPAERTEATAHEYINPDALTQIEHEEDDERHPGDDAPHPQPAVVHLNGAAANIAVTLAVRQLTGRTADFPSLVRYDAHTLETLALHVVPRPDCNACEPHDGTATPEDRP